MPLVTVPLLICTLPQWRVGCRWTVCPAKSVWLCTYQDGNSILFTFRDQRPVIDHNRLFATTQTLGPHLKVLPATLGT